MPRHLYTVCENEYAPNDSTTSFENGGRWNSPGRHVIYTADTYAGALLEVLAHEDTSRDAKGCHPDRREGSV